jgi:hypothetical protein
MLCFYYNRKHCRCQGVIEVRIQNGPSCNLNLSF